jgi:hypothetical protein
MNIVEYIVVATVMIYIVFILVCKLFIFPFWATLPIFHTYDVHRYLYWKPGIVSQTIPPPNQLYYSKNAETQKWILLTDETKKRAHELIQEWYGTTTDSFQSIELSQLETILSNSRITMLTHTVPHYDSVSGWKHTTTYSACLVSHVYRMIVERKEYDIHYLDFLSIPKTESKRVGESLLYTHLWNQRNQDPEIRIAVFKKEGDGLSGCRPFLKYKTWLCNIQNASEYHGNVSLQTTIVNDIHDLQIVYEYITMISTYKIIIYNSLPYIWKQLMERRWFLGILWNIKNQHPLAYYFFTRDWIELSNYKNGYSLQLIHCQSVQAIDDELLFRGFNHLIQSLNSSGEFTLLKINEMGENNRLMPFVKPNSYHSNSLYFNNFIYPARILAPQDCFILL